MPTYFFLTNPGKDFRQLQCVSLKIPTKLPIFMFDADVEVDFEVDVESDVDFKVW